MYGRYGELQPCHVRFVHGHRRFTARIFSTIILPFWPPSLRGTRSRPYITYYSSEALTLARRLLHHHHHHHHYHRHQYHYHHHHYLTNTDNRNTVSHENVLINNKIRCWPPPPPPTLSHPVSRLIKLHRRRPPP
jgi:hypothetical protein|uniref:Uncharacterized protein n=1 Tax=Sipha flava TaxID=143950 RepID=A0A2S2QFR4_9HEMI